ncbi:MAG: endonuclease, partial [Clostridia bacterium]|nr:endonuclease [Clostridia bacterium]
WPNSKGDGNSENDIIMLRPTASDVNSSRGNKAYGESSGYYDPGASVKGDCARIVLYVYTRWGNTTNLSHMWGSNGVIESLDVMLRWMEEDPVDTWEMGRNDVCQNITGTRNVFVDYPEYAWMLFGEEVPDDMITPSGKAKSNVTTENDCEHDYNDWYVLREATETTDGKQMRTCLKCGRTEEEILPKTGTDSSGINLNCSATALPTATLFAAILTTGACIVKKRKK